MNAGSLRHTLRAATRPAHDALDQVWQGAALDERQRYCRFLCATAAALLPTEAALDAAGVVRILPDWALRRRSGAIVQDLRGLALAEPDAAGVRLTHDAGLFGVLYVLEGSRLGGAMLLRQAQAGGDALVRANTRFLRHGASAALWPSFVARLDAMNVSEPDRDRIVGRAVETFARFRAAAVAVGHRPGA